jgi:hypothetical protein
MLPTQIDGKFGLKGKQIVKSLLIGKRKICELSA